MSQGSPKSRLGRRNGSQSNAGSKASASDARHDEQQNREGKSLKTGTGQRGKMKDWQGGSKR